MRRQAGGRKVTMGTIRMAYGGREGSYSTSLLADRGGMRSIPSLPVTSAMTKVLSLPPQVGVWSLKNLRPTSVYIGWGWDKNPRTLTDWKSGGWKIPQGALPRWRCGSEKDILAQVF